jgi:hypothetical protein
MLVCSGWKTGWESLVGPTEFAMPNIDQSTYVKSKILGHWRFVLCILCSCGLNAVPDKWVPTYVRNTLTLPTTGREEQYVFVKCLHPPIKHTDYNWEGNNKKKWLHRAHLYFPSFQPRRAAATQFYFYNKLNASKDKILVKIGTRYFNFFFPTAFPGILKP